MDAARLLFKESTIPAEIADIKEEVNVEELLSDVTLAKLQTIFHSVMKKQVDKIDPIRSKFGKIEKPDYQVDGISGGTITSVAVDAMIKNCLGNYKKFLTNNEGEE